MGSRWVIAGLFWICLAVPLRAQTLDNKSLNGKFFFRQVSVTTDDAANLTDARSLLGVITFDGTARYSFIAQQVQGSQAAASVSGSGTYSVDAAGLVTLQNPLRNTSNINARFSALALIGSSTETGDSTLDLFVAVPAPSSPVSNASLNGRYWMASIELPPAGAMRGALFNMQPDGQGHLPDFNVNGHISTVSSGRPFSQKVSGAVYTLAGDGTGTANFGPASADAPLSGARTLYLSKDGNVLLGGSAAPGSHDVLVGIKAAAAVANATWKDRFWAAGVRLESDSATAYAGAVFAAPGARLIWSRRLHIAHLQDNLDYTLSQAYNLNADGSGLIDREQVGVGANGDAFLAVLLDQSQPSAFTLHFGVRMPAVSGTGVFLNPQGVLNAASLAPAGNPIAPGEFVSLFGTGLAPGQETTTPPYPASTVNGVQVLINDKPAPIQFASPGQINVLVPFATQGPKATVVVINRGMRSNSVVAPVAPTAPGVFSLDRSGTGAGAVLHADFSLVSRDNPARVGETVAIFLTGMGAVNPALPDGTAGGTNPFNLTRSRVSVWIGNRPAAVGYSGLAPGFPGLYQINATVPFGIAAPGLARLTINTLDALHDQFDIPIAF